MMKKNRFVIIGAILLLAIISGAGFIIFEMTRNNKEIKVSGNIEGNDVRISFRVGGQILNLLADEGSDLRIGQIVARLNTDELSKLAKEAEA
ncbi:MAG: hypothetical protein HZA72_03440, partial [Candidatus Omnitrophica bacterium]|nr:hypothetical protein [Candidatus Omnitrophota bacterium]